MVQKRWFIGVLLPKELSKRISVIQHDLVDEKTMLKPLVPHITLIHPNPLMELSPLYFAPIAKIATEHLLPCDVQLDSVGVFNKNVIFIKVKSPVLEQIHNKLVSALPHNIQAQYFVGREFVAHITMAQTRGRGKFEQSFIAQFENRVGPLLPAQFIAEKLTRYEWQGSRLYSAKDL